MDNKVVVNLYAIVKIDWFVDYHGKKSEKEVDVLQGKNLHEPFAQEAKVIADPELRRWLRNCYLKKKTERIICATKARHKKNIHHVNLVCFFPCIGCVGMLLKVGNKLVTVSSYSYKRRIDGAM